MDRINVLELIKIDDYSVTPKYQQLGNAILDGIRKGLIKKDDMMPSINEVSFEFDISRVTVEKGYNELRKMGILDSVPGKGYYIKSIDVSQHLSIFLLFNKLSQHKKIIYDTLTAELGDQAAIDFYVYNNDLGLFHKILNKRKNDYTHFVIIPHFIEGEDKAPEIINSLPKDKLILVDKLLKNVSGEFGAVYENFDKNIFDALLEAKERLTKYKTLNLIFPENSYYPKEIIRGFENFCSDFAFDFKIIHTISEEEIMPGNVYINLMEDDLIILIDKVLSTRLQVGKDVGIISYNETPLKRFILNGLSTMSTDFEAMGKSIAKLILEKPGEHIENPFKLTLRDSL
ncbi:GntR family transcriptional regulator [Jiulongibacter sediminis]|uniref:Transcriptional regulator n=1 Tax=Jiulongibacter sediminis TaxID=1605367 RepID=A0A0P7C0H8_9BACT|nr:winged helix-turn-helix domain-containing protein [Jiulongibacter sediminis]KPM50118.1 transcriptional regulator [Jiulongibacter sediminis]TBX27138.1 transcriptional regulator [Jiulongibacter sediminis]